jgi:hypothetical protein
VLSLPLAGFYTLSYWQTLSVRLRRLRVRQLPPGVRAGLRVRRAAVLSLLDEARAEYLSRML